MWKRSSSAKSILPTTAPSPSSPPPKNPKRPRRPNLGTAFPSSSPSHDAFDPNKSCTNFLLGGTYYPGKDKTASHLLRRRSVWYRIFCSSMPRVGVTVIVISYVVLWYVVAPTVGVLLGYGRMLAGGGHGGGGGRVVGRVVAGKLLSGSGYGLSVPLPPLDVARTDALRLLVKVKEIRHPAPGEGEGEDRRMDMLEKLVPNWIHRNDLGAEEGLVVDGEDGDGGEKKKAREAEEVADTDALEDANNREKEGVEDGDDHDNVRDDEEEADGSADGAGGDADVRSGDGTLHGKKLDDGRDDDHDRIEGSGDDNSENEVGPIDSNRIRADKEAGKPPLAKDVKKKTDTKKGDGRIPPEKVAAKAGNGNGPNDYDAIDRLEGSDDYSAADEAVDTNDKADRAGKNNLAKITKKKTDAKKDGGRKPAHHKEAEDAKANGKSSAKGTKPASDSLTNADKKHAEEAKDGIDGKAAIESKEKQTTAGEVETRVQRTLQNMHSIPSTSSCPSDLSPDHISTTLVIQTSFNRLNLLLETCNRWHAPIILALYLATEDEDESWSGSQSMWEEMCPQMTVIPHAAVGAEREAREYPVNLLRNTGLDAVKTSHVMMMDVDFLPSADLHDTIQDTLKARHQVTTVEGLDSNGYMDALIVPAFERKPPKECETMEECMEYLKKDSNFIPRSIDGLRDCTERNDCIVFQSDVNWEGHHTTHSEKWLKGDWYDDGNYREPAVDEGTGKAKAKQRRDKLDLGRKVKKVECFDSLRYEPWVVLRWCPSLPPTEDETGNRKHPRPVAPYFDERFHGYGKNKIEMTAHLRFLGYSFSILPLGFIIHQPHPQSKAKQVWVDTDKDDLHHQMDALYPKFLRELAAMYAGGKNVIPTCERPKKKKTNKAKKKGNGR